MSVLTDEVIALAKLVYATKAATEEKPSEERLKVLVGESVVASRIFMGMMDVIRQAEENDEPGGRMVG